MVKYHIRKDGTPGICTAENSCPLGGEEEHFDSFDKAMDYADKKNKAEIKELESK